MVGGGDVKRAGMAHNRTVQTQNRHKLLLTWLVTVLYGFETVMGQFQNMDLLNCNWPELLLCWTLMEQFRNQPKTIENRLRPSKILQINGHILSGRFKFLKNKNIFI